MYYKKSKLRLLSFGAMLACSPIMCNSALSQDDAIDSADERVFDFDNEATESHCLLQTILHSIGRVFGRN